MWSGVYVYRKEMSGCVRGDELTSRGHASAESESFEVLLGKDVRDPQRSALILLSCLWEWDIS